LKQDGKLFDIQGFIQAKALGPILSQTTCKYLFPTVFPDTVLVGATLDSDSIDDSRFALKHTVWSLRHSRPVAIGSGEVTLFDYSTGTKATIPKVLLKAFDEIQINASDVNEIKNKFDKLESHIKDMKHDMI
jgi:acyl-CoA thioesterase FadM